ncbi:unnamed protein product [Rodentolepis nana]|uniref:COMM domain-containing protein n=1 Tax=Rodentolepis nana TaxID=102285 RepID=A0A0R3TDD7_RODNA|nr:unnamed protein product [Rodentolepis nana]
MPQDEIVIIGKDMPSCMLDNVLAIIQSVFKSNAKSKESVHRVVRNASEMLSKRLKKLEDRDWQVAVVKGSVSSTCVHKPGRLLTAYYKPYTVLIWQSK